MLDNEKAVCDRSTLSLPTQTYVDDRWCISHTHLYVSVSTEIAWKLITGLHIVMRLLNKDLPLDVEIAVVFHDQGN
jgi:hypothetical protein